MLNRIHDLEAGILSQLVAQLTAAYTGDMRRASEALATLDCLLALAQAAHELNLCRPLLTSANELHIKNGRHLLTELLVERFIPNDTHMEEVKERIHVSLARAWRNCWPAIIANIQISV
jgi:DNA mismatch repair ATPase MutS